MVDDLRAAWTDDGLEFMYQLIQAIDTEGIRARIVDYVEEEGAAQN